MTLRQPTKRVRIRQFVRDDWRWSKGTDALRYFEEVTLAKSLLDLARKILGTGSRYPARIADDTDCVTEVTAWGTLLVRPRGTGANVALAKRMLYEVLHPSGENLREDALITPDEMAEAAVRDLTTIAQGEEEDVGDKLKTGVQRTSHDLRRVGLGAEKEAMEAATKVEAKSETKEVELATAEDVRLVQKHMDDIRIASGAIPMLVSMKLRCLGKEKAVRKAMYLVKTLVETGEWFGLTDGFVMSEETREKRKASEGPAEQILIKIGEGPVIKKIEKHLKDIEYAALADALKLTSKAVNGKRTLMVDGTRAAHERVKLMIKELAEKGESPMLTKSLAIKGGLKEEIKEEPVVKVEPGIKIKIEPDDKASNSVQVAPGVISAAPVLIDDFGTSSSSTAPAAKDDKAEPAVKASKGLGAGPAMRHLPAPKLTVEIGKGEDLFAGLPAPEFPSAGSSDSAGAGTGAGDSAGSAGPPAAEASPAAAAGATAPSAEAAPAASFPPQPPGLATEAAAAATAAAAAAATAEAAALAAAGLSGGVGPVPGVPQGALAAAEQELLQQAASTGALAGVGGDQASAGITE